MTRLIITGLCLIAATVWLPMVTNGDVIMQQPVAERIVPPSNVNMQLEGTATLQDGACIPYYKTRDRGEGSARASRGDVVWKVVDGQAIEVLAPGRAVSDGNGTMGVEDGWGFLYVVDKENGLLKLPIPGWQVGACGGE